MGQKSPFVYVASMQSKKQYYDGELDRVERQHRQQAERMEAEHTARLREEARRLKAQQERELERRAAALKADPREVGGRQGASCLLIRPFPVTAHPAQGHWESSAFPRNHGARGRGHSSLEGTLRQLAI